MSKTPATETHPSRFAQFLRTLRASRRESAEHAAEVVGVLANTWLRWEHGLFMPNDANLERICEWADDPGLTPRVLKRWMHSDPAPLRFSELVDAAA